MTKFKIGDKVVADIASMKSDGVHTTDLSKGTEYIVERVDSDGYLHFLDDIDDRRMIHPQHFSVVQESVPEAAEETNLHLKLQRIGQLSTLEVSGSLSKVQIEMILDILYKEVA